MGEQRTYGQRVWRFASGPRLAVGLLVAFTALSVAGVLYPQRRLMTAADVEALHRQAPMLSRLAEAVGLDRLFTTPLFLGVLLLLAVSTACCTLRRALERREPRVPGRLPDGGPGVRELADGVRPERLGRALGPRFLVRHGTEERETGTWALASAGRIGFWGSMLFHAALLVIAAGGVLSGLTSFSGKMLATEGQTVVDERASYLEVSEVPRLGGAFTGRRFTLARLSYEYDGATLTRAGAAFTLPDAPDRRPIAAGVNYPLELAGRSYLLGNSGYAALVTVSDAGGDEPLVVNLGERRDAGYSDVMQLRDGTTMQLYAVPRADVPLGEEVARRYEISKPVLHVVVQQAGAAEVRRRLAEGESLPVGDIVVRFDGLRLWNELIVRQDGGKLLVYTGFWLAVAGLAVRLADPDRRVLLARKADGSVLVARHRYGRAASDALAERVAARLGQCEDTSEEVSR